MAQTFTAAYAVYDVTTGAFLGVSGVDGNMNNIQAATLTGISYNGSNQVTGYTLNGIAFTVAYPNSTTITITGAGHTKTITLDGSGRISGLTFA